jgi:hypothetical protein
LDGGDERVSPRVVLLKQQQQKNKDGKQDPFSFQLHNAQTTDNQQDEGGVQDQHKQQTQLNTKKSSLKQSSSTNNAYDENYNSQGSKKLRVNFTIEEENHNDMPLSSERSSQQQNQKDFYNFEDEDIQRELEGMQSPISRRKEIAPELDEMEEEIFEALQEYRGTEVYNEFKNYKTYYEDAKTSNNIGKGGEDV